MMRFTVAAVTVVALGALTVGCGGSSSSDGGGGSDSAPVTTKQPATKQATTTTAEVTTTTVDPEVVIRQYVSELNPELSKVSDLRDGMNECVSLSTVPDCVVLLPTTVISAGYVAETITIKLSTLERDVGPPPAEIQGLVEDTERAALALQQGSEEWSDADCSYPTQGECPVLTGGVNGPLRSLNSAVEKWRPYGVG